MGLEVAPGGEEAHEAGFAFPCADEAGAGKTGLDGGVLSECSEQGQGKELKGDGAGDGVAGEREEWERAGGGAGLGGAGEAAEGDGFAGLDGDATEEEASAAAGERGGDEVEFSDGDSAGDEEQIDTGGGFKGGADGGVEGVGGVVHDGHGDWHGSGGGDHGGEHGGVGVTDLAGAGHLVVGDEFVAAGEDGDAGSGVDGEFAVTALGGDGDLGWCEANAGGHEGVADAALCAAGDEVVAGGDGATDKLADKAVAVLNVLQHEDAVCAFGQGCAGHDFEDFPGCEGAVGELAGANEPGLEEPAVGVGLSSAAGEAVAGGAGESGLVAVGGDGGGEDAAAGGFQGEELRDSRSGRGRGRWRLAEGCGNLSASGEGEHKPVHLLGGLIVAQKRVSHTLTILALKGAGMGKMPGWGDVGG